MDIVTALTISGLGVLVLRYCWRRPMQGKSAWLLLAWLLLALSVWPLAHWIGPEFAWVAALSVPSALALLLVLLNHQNIPAKPASAVHMLLRTPGRQVVGRELLRFLLVFFVALACSLLLSLGLSAQLIDSDSNRLGLVFIVFPILWGLVAYFICLSNRLFQSVCALLSVGLLGALLIWF